MNTEGVDLGTNSTAWIGDTPPGWELKRLGKLFRERRTTVSDSDYAALSVTRQGVVPQLADVAKTQNGDVRKLVRRGDFAINSRSDRKGSSGMADRDGSVSVITTVLEPQAIRGRFAHHLMRSIPFQEEFYRFGTGIVADLWSTRWSSMKSIIMPVPHADEQDLIADYLDRETAEIDAFIADQEKLIELLTERRAATVLEVVDPADSRLFEDGSWTRGPLKRWLRSLDHRRIPLSSEERGTRPGPFPYYGASGIIDHVNDYLFNAEHVLVSEDGANLVLRSRPIAFVARGKYWVNNHAHVLQPRFGSSDFWARRIDALDVRPWVTGAAQPKLTIEAVMNLPVSCPATTAEFARIDATLADRTAEIDATTQDAREAIALSNERRASLISAAVTGKIDVRVHGKVRV